MFVLGDNIGKIELIDHMGDDLSIVNAARKSFNKDKKEFDHHDKKLLRYLWENHHDSPREMVVFKFSVTAPLFVINQWVRHRTFSYNIRSFRYTEDNIQFYLPRSLRAQSKINKQGSTEEFVLDNDYLCSIIKKHCADSLSKYETLLEGGVAREMARLVLPQNIYTEMIFKADLRNLLHFIELRYHPHAQLEIQKYAKAIVELIEPIVPETMKLFRELLIRRQV